MNEKYCHRCGSPVPGDAKFCTKCGAPVAGSGNDAPAPRNNHAEIRALLIAIGVLAALVAVIWVYGVYSEKRAARMEHDKFISDSLQAVERQRQDSIEWEQGRLDRVKTAYKKEIDNRIKRDSKEPWWPYSGVDDFYYFYFLYDVTGDGVPELCMGYPSGGDPGFFDIYTYENEKVRRIYSDGSWFLSFHDCGGYLLGVRNFSTSLEEPYEWHKFVYDGKNLTTKVIFSEDVFNTGREPTKPKEPEIKRYKVTDMSPIDSMTINKK